MESNVGFNGVHTTDARFLPANTLRVYYVSDIHLEMRSKVPKKILEDVTGLSPIPIDDVILSRSVLVLAGDIGSPFQSNYRAFLTLCNDTFRYVFVIAGNHEFYTSHTKQHTMSEITCQLKTVCAQTGCHYLDADSAHNFIVRFPRDTTVDARGTTPIIESLYYGDDQLEVRFAGCTLWTAADSRAEMIMNDYNKIYTGEGAGHRIRVASEEGLHGTQSWRRAGVKLLTHHDVNYGLHHPHRAFLASTLTVETDARPIPTVIVTHHAPSFKMLANRKENQYAEFTDSSDDEEESFVNPNYIPKKDRVKKSVGPSLSDTLYATDLEFMFTSPLCAWISGHTHGSYQTQINNIPCVSNCYGYPNQLPSHTGFSYAWVDINMTGSPRTSPENSVCLETSEQSVESEVNRSPKDKKNS